MDRDLADGLETSEQFWAEVDRVLSLPCFSPESIDDCLRCYLALAIDDQESHLLSDDDVTHFAYKLQTASVFVNHGDYVRRQFIYGILQEEDAAALRIFAAIILFDGRENEKTFTMMKEEGVFPRLVELIQIFGRDPEQASVNKLFLELIYEMARILTLGWHDLAAVGDAFVLTLLSLTESVSSDAADPYHYCVIRVLLVINEQYMVSASEVPTPGKPPNPPLTNRVVKAISTHASVYKTFGENLILLLNREKEAILQIQILKLLYLVFGTKSTSEYFYTNDLHVLLDVILRNLLDLPTDDDFNPGQNGTPGMTQALRHTYLRVLHHLLENSQLRRPGMSYKPIEITAVLDLLAGRRAGTALHFEPLDDTTLRLADRCLAVAWLRAGAGRSTPPPRINESTDVIPDTSLEAEMPSSGFQESARRRLGMTVSEATSSSLSMVEVAQHTEKPGLITPSRGFGSNGRTES